MEDLNKIDLAWRTVLKFSGIICINCFFCLMLMFIAGIHTWTIAVTFLISLAGCVIIQNQFNTIKVHEAAYKEFIKTVSMFAIILLFMALTVKKISHADMDNILLYSTIPVMVNFIIAIPSWFIHKYRQGRQRRKNAHRGLLGDY